MPKCNWCDSTDVRVVSEGWGKIPPSYSCEACYTWPEGGHNEPCWDDHPRPQAAVRNTLAFLRSRLTATPADIMELKLKEFEDDNG